MQEGDKLCFSDTMYKRLWWSGFRGTFVSFRWPCLTGAPSDIISYYLYGDVDGTFTFNSSEFIALSYASSLTNYIASLTGRVHVIAHSQGNMLASEALRLGAKVNSYAMLDAAVPAFAYDVNAPESLGLSTLESLDPTFDASQSGSLDAGYRGWFSTIGRQVSGNILNYFNPEDYALGTYAWLLNEAGAKPAAYASSYLYDFDQMFPLGYKHFVFGLQPLGVYRTVSTQYEIMAFMARSATLAAGAQSGLGAPVTLSRDLSLSTFTSLTGVEADHSGLFNRPIQTVWPFCVDLLQQCGISTPSHPTPTY
jgi:pimeloyl-ACP methyl ester carboxylesterase